MVIDLSLTLCQENTKHPKCIETRAKKNSTFVSGFSKTLRIRAVHSQHLSHLHRLGKICPDSCVSAAQSEEFLCAPVFQPALQGHSCSQTIELSTAQRQRSSKTFCAATLPAFAALPMSASHKAPVRTSFNPVITTCLLAGASTQEQLRSPLSAKPPARASHQCLR